LMFSFGHNGNGNITFFLNSWRFSSFIHLSIYFSLSEYPGFILSFKLTPIYSCFNYKSMSNKYLMHM
jgi:hypothetical protein